MQDVLESIPSAPDVELVMGSDAIL